MVGTSLALFVPAIHANNTIHPKMGRTLWLNKVFLYGGEVGIRANVLNCW